MAQHDPKGNSRNNGEGPPDLDDVLQTLSKRFYRLLGKGKGFNYPEKSPRTFKRGISGIIVTLLVLWTLSGFYVVDERENAVITRFGRYIETIDKSGLHWHFPVPIEQRELVNVTEVRSLEVGNTGNSGSSNEEGIMLTGDQNIIQMQLEIQYNISSARDFLYNNRLNSTDGRDIVKQSAQTAIREVVGRNNVDYVLNEGRGKIAEDTQILIQSLLNKYGSGIFITRVNISDVQPPEQVQEAFADAVKARQDKARLVNEGQAYANDVIPRASGMAARLTAEAQGYKKQVILQATGDAKRFEQILTERNKAPQTTEQRLYIEAMQQIYSQTSKVLTNSNSNNLLYLPLDKLLQLDKQNRQSSTTMGESSIKTEPSQQQNRVEKTIAPSAVLNTELARGRGELGEREGR